MDEELLRALEGEIDKQSSKVLKSYYARVESIFVNALIQSVYDYYSPKTYERTYQLRNAINFEITDNSLIVFIDVNKLKYRSAVDGRYVGEAVPYFIEVGHSDGTGINNQYHNFEGRKYLESAVELVRRDLGIDAEIVLQKPLWV